MNLFPENALIENNTLSQNHYFYSLIKNNAEAFKDKSKHIYKLSPEETHHKYMIIELSNCKGYIGFVLKSFNKQYSNSSIIDKKDDILYSTSEHYGKKLISIDLPEHNKDIVLIVYSDNNSSCAKSGKTYLSSDEKNCFNSYSIRYNTYISKHNAEVYGLQNKGTITSNIDNDGNVKLEWGSVSKNKDSEMTNEAYFYITVIDSKDIQNFSDIDSVCSSNIKPVKQYFKKSASEIGSDKLIIEKTQFPKNGLYYIHIVARTMDGTKTLLNYTPVSVNIEDKGTTSWIFGNYFIKRFSYCCFAYSTNCFSLYLYKKN